MRFWRLAAAVLLAHGGLGGVSEAGFSSIVAFGDSLSDTGNVFAATGTPPTPYYAGHYSNGPIWVEDLAGGLGLAAPTPSALGGTDYAWGGAETGTGLSTLKTPNLLTQVGGFVAGHTLSPDALVTVWAGGNDFLNAHQTNPLIPVENIGAAITTLAADGGKTFLVPNLPLLGEIPGTLGLPKAQRDGLDALSAAFNAALTAKLDALQANLGVKIDRLDVNGIIQLVRSNPAAYDFTNTTTGALNDGVVSGQGYLFWDDVHPTAAGHAVIARAALGAVPEPSSLALTAAAGAILLGGAAARARRPRRAA